jgi:large repetitive protein
LPDGKLRVPYSQTISVTGIIGDSIRYSITSGSLPDGLVLDAVTGKISGRPTSFGTFNFTVHVDHWSGCSKNHDYSINIIKINTHT